MPSDITAGGRVQREKGVNGDPRGIPIFYSGDWQTKRTPVWSEKTTNGRGKGERKVTGASVLGNSSLKLSQGKTQ